MRSAWTSQIKQTLVEALAIALVWVFFFRLNLFVFAHFEFNSRVYWLFLPAGIRMMAVFIFGWKGVLGLFIGSTYTNEAETDAYVLGLSAISALSPMLALLLCRWFYNLASTLKGLKAKQLLVFTLIGGLVNSLLSQLYFYATSTDKVFFGFVPMFVGDVLGTLLFFYMVAKLLEFLSAYHKVHG